MPLVRIDHLPHSVMGLWKMTERAIDLPCPKDVAAENIHSESRLLERLVSYELVRELTGQERFRIAHDASGRPLLEGWNISISHTRGWAVVILSTERRVAVDIEYLSERVNRVAHKFIRKDEYCVGKDGQPLEEESKDRLLGRLINWCAKETAYKFFTEEDLQYFEMRLLPFEPQGKGKVIVEDLKVPKRLDVNFETNSDFVLTWAVE